MGISILVAIIKPTCRLIELRRFDLSLILLSTVVIVAVFVLGQRSDLGSCGGRIWVNVCMYVCMHVRRWQGDGLAAKAEEDMAEGPDPTLDQDIPQDDPPPNLEPKPTLPVRRNLMNQVHFAHRTPKSLKLDVVRVRPLSSSFSGSFLCLRQPPRQCRPYRP